MYLPSDKRYDKMIYSRCGRSGLKLPKVSMGLWQNFGHQGRFSDMEEMVHTAFDLGLHTSIWRIIMGILIMEVQRKILGGY